MNRAARTMVLLGAVACAAACGGRTKEDSSAGGDGAVAEAPQAATDTGEATYYADILHRRRTASGEPLDQSKMVAAHRSYPFGTILRVTNLDNGRSTRLRVIDRGPYSTGRSGKARILDVSKGAARRLGFLRRGAARVEVAVVQWGPGLGE